MHFAYCVHVLVCFGVQTGFQVLGFVLHVVATTYTLLTKSSNLQYIDTKRQWQQSSLDLAHQAQTAAAEAEAVVSQQTIGDVISMYSN